MDVVLVKVGSNVLTTDSGELDLNILRDISKQITNGLKLGYHFILVSSGAVASGSIFLDYKMSFPMTLRDRHCAAAIGQVLLMNEYQKNFSTHNGSLVAQLLLTRNDLEDPTLSENLKDSIFRLLYSNIIPIINENDGVASEDITFGDNDKLSSRISVLCNVSKYIILTDIEGVYTSDPHTDSEATLIKEFNVISDTVDGLSIGGAFSKKGRGGMVSKVDAAYFSASKGIDTYIVNGRKERIIQDVLLGYSLGTRFFRD